MLPFISQAFYFLLERSFAVIILEKWVLAPLAMFISISVGLSNFLFDLHLQFQALCVLCFNRSIKYIQRKKALYSVFKKGPKTFWPFCFICFAPLHACEAILRQECNLEV